MVATVSMFALASAAAAPRIEPLREIDLVASQACHFRLPATRRQNGQVVMQWGAGQASMRLDGRLVRLEAEEAKCMSNCVVQGGRGERTFVFTGSGVKATLKKNVACARDSESCAGLPEGTARLIVSMPTGRTVATVWGAYCDE